MNDTQSHSCNAPVGAVDRARRIAENRIALSGFVDPMLALLAADLARAGCALIPPISPGGHTEIVLSDGTRLSLAVYFELARWLALERGRCAECGRRTLAVALNLPRRRAPRADRQYCSNACRQRAYRKRKANA